MIPVCAGPLFFARPDFKTIIFFRSVTPFFRRVRVHRVHRLGEWKNGFGFEHFQHLSLMGVLAIKNIGNQNEPIFIFSEKVFPNVSKLNFFRFQANLIHPTFCTKILRINGNLNQRYNLFAKLRHMNLQYSKISPAQNSW